MVKRDFCLSEKRRIPFDCVPDNKTFYFYPENDIKEFIKILKDEIHKLGSFSERNFKIVFPQIIDALAGEKLTQNGKN